MPGDLLDASALLAYLRDEPGGKLVSGAIAAGAVIGTVNLVEVLSRAADRGADPVALAHELAERGLLGGAIAVEPLTVSDAIEAARLRPLTRDAGLSLGDRCCLALARRLQRPVLTADTAWSVPDLDLEIQQIR